MWHHLMISMWLVRSREELWGHEVMKDTRWESCREMTGPLGWNHLYMSWEPMDLSWAIAGCGREQRREGPNSMGSSVCPGWVSQVPTDVRRGQTAQRGALGTFWAAKFCKAMSAWGSHQWCHWNPRGPRQWHRNYKFMYKWRKPETIGENLVAEN